MIEIIGSRELYEQELQWRTLPKNLRQIGETRDRRKIYIEDYVVTYLNRLAIPQQAYARGAVLMGNIYRTEAGDAVFISGAVEAQNLEFDMDETVFNEEIWKELLEQGKKYFPEQRVMGWFLSRMGFSVEVNQKIIDTHMRNFPGNYRVLYMIDALEKEDAMYICENGKMVRQKGYYIYYEKNSPMQEYMVSVNRSRGERNEYGSNVEEEKLGQDKRVVKRYRKKNSYKKESQKQTVPIRLVRIASILLILIMSISIYQRMENRSGIWPGMSETVVETMGRAVRLLVPKEQAVEEETQNGETTSTDAESKTRAEAETDTEAEHTESSSEEETENVMAPMYYIVEKGDTLAAISRKMYMTDKYMKQIAWANGLEDADEIYVGQKILIPAID